MPSIYVKEFSAIATQSGTKKLTSIKNQKNKPAYHPSKDYYKAFREKISDIFKHKLQLSDLSDIATNQTDFKKKGNYAILAKSFISWAKGKNIQWHDPIKNIYHSSQTEIICNPELNLTVNGSDYIIKLYFSVNDPMNQERANYICYLMESSIDIDDMTYAVLDVKTKKLFTFTGNRDIFHIAVESEIASLEKAWAQL